LTSSYSSSREYNFVDGDICGYQISAPAGAMDGDLLTVITRKLTYANAYATYGEDYSTARSYKTISKGKSLTVEHPN
jgi:hypothetical protein